MQRLKSASVLIVTLVSLGCSHLGVTRPLECKEIADVPGLKEQILEARDRDNTLNQLRLPPQTDKLRDYALDSSAVCHGNKKLR